MKISVLGCGRWGSFIAWYLNKIGHDVILWGREGSGHLNSIKEFRKNEYLSFSPKIEVTDDLFRAANVSEIIVVSISAQSLRSFAKTLCEACPAVKNKVLVLCMKGIEESTGKRLSRVAKEVLGEDTKVAVWVGPGHVQDFSAGIPNCMVIDSYDAQIKNKLAAEFSSPLIRFYYGNDMIGNEIGAAAKNVMGIAAGVLDGMHYESLKGALMSRGTREISRLISALGGNKLSAYGLAHLGDYQATLFSPHSNNRKFGESLVSGAPYTKLAEGAATSRALVAIAKSLDVELPICSAVNDAVHNSVLPQKAITDLFLRKVKHEF